MRETRKTIGDRRNDSTGKNGVKQEGHKGLSAGAQGKICSVCIGMDRHERSVDQNKPGGKMTHVFAGVIDGGKHAGTQGHHTAEQQTGKFGEYDKLSVRVDRVFPQPCTQLLTDDDADGRSHGKEGNIEYVAQRKGDVCGCNDVIAANGIALLKQRLTQRPERLVQDQGHPLSCNLPGKLRGNTEAAINTFDKRILLSIAMRPKNDDECLDVTGDHRGDGSPVRAQAGKPQLTEDQQPVADKIDGNGDDSRSVPA